ncbi:MCE family protein [Plantactinospora endophytica]|uniref:ABC transporter substrate-binding protein n=1 Tax=Plantactinospora endophytica TaxID=673535 RepID=A0ABQ4DXC2_9ACTN|nr:MCE family protein [Plantactinospora endophytica]GIG87097.1 ABC transporter substrate-binding protein [Plantactinospora endophytica]
MNTRGSAVGRRFLGIVFVVVLVAALTLAVLQYRKAFTPVAWVTLYTAQTGMQLSPGAEVKLRGVPVGEVREVGSDGSRARLRLALDPDRIGHVPADVAARLLPKTLFGERYVALVAPAGSTAGPLRAGATIDQDRSRNGVELERVLDEALPLLQRIRPDKLASTLAALATALDGRGEQLGQTLETLDGYLTELNRELPTLTEDVRRLAAVLDSYDAALPDLLAILRDVTPTARTVADQRTQLAAFLAETTDAADVTRLFLDRHGEQVIRLGELGRPVLELLAAYAPEYPCLMRGLVGAQPLAEEVFRNGRMHVTLEITRDNGAYQPGRDDPVYGASTGPQCRELPNPTPPAPEVRIEDGYDHGGSRPGPVKLPVGKPPTGTSTGTPAADSPPSMGSAGTTDEKDLLKPIIGAATDTLPVQVPDIAVLLWGPLLRGAVVNVR